jgi:hypothetical protein
MKFIFFLVLLVGCALPTHWQANFLTTGESTSSSGRLRFTPEDSLSGVSLEFVRTKNLLTAYLISKARRLSVQKTVQAELQIDDSIYKTELCLHEGNMKAILPEEWTQAATKALLDGREIAIMIGSIKQTIQPEQFSALYNKLIHSDGTLPLLPTREILKKFKSTIRPIQQPIPL